jgi:hypothetical protein
MQEKTHVKVNTVVRSTMKGATSVMVLKTRVTVMAGGMSWGCTDDQCNLDEKQRIGRTTAATKERRERQRWALRVLKIMVDELMGVGWRTRSNKMMLRLISHLPLDSCVDPQSAARHSGLIPFKRTIRNGDGPTIRPLN